MELRSSTSFHPRHSTNQMNRSKSSERVLHLELQIASNPVLSLLACRRIVNGTVLLLWVAWTGKMLKLPVLLALAVADSTILGPWISLRN